MLTTAALLALLALPPAAQEVRLEEHGLTLALPFPGEDARREAGREGETWTGRIGPSEVTVRFRTLPVERYGFREPDDVLDVGPSFWSSPDHQRGESARRRAWPGPYGWAPYAVWEREELTARSDGRPVGRRYLLAGLLREHGYWFTVEAVPAPDDATDDALREFLRSGIVYAGEVRDHRWSDEEVRARWLASVPEDLRDDLASPVRTEHYVVLTDAKGGASFARRMEKHHDALLELFPFDDVAGRRLMPLFLFRNQDEYRRFAASAGIWDETSRGHAAQDYYATWDDAHGDPAHLAGATRQLLSVRLGLGGGGAWLQDGLARYTSSSKRDRKDAAARVRKGEHVPLSELVTLRTLAPAPDPTGTPPEDPEVLADQAALLIEFLREDDDLAERFPDFLRAAGRTAANDRHGVEAAAREVYGLDLAGLEARWSEYCGRR